MPKKNTVNGRVTREFVYDGLGRRIKEKRNGGLFANYAYYDDGNFKWAKDANQRGFYASDYKLGTPQKITRENGDVTNQFVDDFGRVVSTVDANRNRTEFTRDSMGRLISVDLPGSWAGITHRYDFSDVIKHTITKNKSQTTITYDAMFRPKLIETKDLNTNNSSYVKHEYDSAGREVFTSLPSSISNATTGVTIEYDGLGRVVKQRETVHPFAETLISYHAEHRKTVTDAVGNKTHYFHYGYNGATYNDVKAIHSPLGLYTNINKNVWGEITSIEQWGSQGYFDSSSSAGGNSGGSNDLGVGTPGSGTVTPGNPGDVIILPPGNEPVTFSSGSSNTDDDMASGVNFSRHYFYDNSRRLCRISQADVGDTLYQYDASGWLIAYQNGAEQGSGCSAPSGSGKITLIRDKVGRVKKRDFAHSGTSDIIKSYDGNGNVLSVNRGGVNWTYTYNSLNLPESELLNIDGRAYSLRYQYNEAGHLNVMTLPTGREINLNPDGLGRPTQASWGSNYYAENIKYHPNGMIESFSYGNGQTYKQTLTANQLPKRLLTTNGITTPLDLTYSYDERKLTKQIKDGTSSSNNRLMGYDALERLTSATGPWGSSSIEYDSLGNIRSKSLGNRVVSMTYSDRNQLTRAIDTGGVGGTTGDRQFTYDSRGNTVKAGNLTFSYDYANQPVLVSGDNSGGYVYDGNLKRVKSTVAGKTIFNVYNLSGRLVHIDNASENKKTDYVSAGAITVTRITNNSPTYLHHDSVGSPVAGTSSNGTISWKERYTPFGITLDNSSTNNDQAGYTGHIKDNATGLIYMQARYYDPVIGRFYSNDPVDAMGHVSRGNPVHGFNRYTYANNNPYKYVDPDGEFAVFGAVFSVAVEVIYSIGTGQDITAANIATAAVTGFVGGGVSQLTKVGKLGKMAGEAIDSGVGIAADVAKGESLDSAVVGNLGGKVLGKTAGELGSSAKVGGPDLLSGPNTKKKNAQIKKAHKREVANTRQERNVAGNVVGSKLGGEAAKAAYEHQEQQ